MIIGMHHVGVVTRNIEQLAGFYRTYFFAEKIKEFTWGPENAGLNARLGAEGASGRIMLLGFANARLELFQFLELPRPMPERSMQVAKPGFNHICFQVDDCFAEYERLKGLGMPFHDEPLTMPSGSVFTYGRDADANVVELLQPGPSHFPAS